MTKKMLILLILGALGFQFRYEIKSVIKNYSKDNYSFPKYHSKGNFDLYYYINYMKLKNSSHRVSLNPSLAGDFIKISTENFKAKCEKKIYKRSDYIVYKCHVEDDFSGTGEYKNDQIYAMFRMAKEINIDTEFEETTIKLNISDTLVCLEEAQGRLAGRWNSEGCWNREYAISAEYVK